MMIKRNRKGFTLVELLIVVAIIAVLSGAAYIGIQRSQSRGMNQRMTADLSAIVNALEQYKQDNGSYPLPALGADKNVLCFKEDLSYFHGAPSDCATALFMQAQIDNTLLTKRYLQEVPTDPRTASRYAYGVTADGKYYQVAGNYEETDGTWTARTVGNVNDYPFLPSLIRAYNGPDFVVNGEGWLPYSPDHLVITARLADITGTVKIDTTLVTAASPDELKTVKPGSTITTTGPASSAVLYFSDGSITYLDPDTTLRVLPSTEVQKNDKDGIITKIRLKLSFGKIWNKVARLASKSEFNVETTGAIAGVRGTEFGIDAATNELIVLSGIVVARRMNSTELAQLSGGDGSITFDSSDASFDDKKATGNGTTFNRFILPTDPNTPMPTAGTPLSLSEQDVLRQKYYVPSVNLSPADTPYIVKAVSKTDGTYTVFVTFNGFKSDGTKIINGFEIYGESQTAGMSTPRALKEEAQNHPLQIVEAVTYSPADKAYTFDIDYKTVTGNPLYNQDTGEMERITLRAFNHNYGKTVYSRLSWPLIGLTPDATSVQVSEYDNSRAYQEFFGQLPPQPPLTCNSGQTQSQSCPIPNGTGSQTRTCGSNVWGPWSTCLAITCIPGYFPNGGNCEPTLATICAAGSGTLYDNGSGEACWKVASNASENCDTVCTAISLNGKDLSCSNSPDWTVDSALCSGLGYTFNTATVPTNYSPVLFAGSKCRNDDDNVRSCSQPAATPYKRICRCE